MTSFEEDKETEVNLPLDAECNALLTTSAKKHKRKKRPEAAVRLIDHLLRFGVSWQKSTSGEGSDPSPDENDDTHVNFLLDAQCNDILNKSANAHDRTKREEGAKRLKDHLLRFDESWHEKPSERHSKSR